MRRGGTSIETAAAACRTAHDRKRTARTWGPCTPRSTHPDTPTFGQSPQNKEGPGGRPRRSDEQPQRAAPRNHHPHRGTDPAAPRRAPSRTAAPARLTAPSRRADLRHMHQPGRTPRRAPLAPQPARAQPPDPMQDLAAEARPAAHGNPAQFSEPFHPPEHRKLIRPRHHIGRRSHQAMIILAGRCAYRLPDVRPDESLPQIGLTQMKFPQRLLHPRAKRRTIGRQRDPILDRQRLRRQHVDLRSYRPLSHQMIMHGGNRFCPRDWICIVIPREKNCDRAQPHVVSSRPRTSYAGHLQRPALVILFIPPMGYAPKVSDHAATPGLEPLFVGTGRQASLRHFRLIADPQNGRHQGQGHAPRSVARRPWNNRPNRNSLSARSKHNRLGRPVLATILGLQQRPGVEHGHGGATDKHHACRARSGRSWHPFHCGPARQHLLVRGVRQQLPRQPSEVAVEAVCRPGMNPRQNSLI